MIFDIEPSPFSDLCWPVGADLVALPSDVVFDHITSPELRQDFGS
jgi:hypothetical protein